MIDFIFLIHSIDIFLILIMTRKDSMNIPDNPGTMAYNVFYNIPDPLIPFLLTIPYRIASYFSILDFSFLTQLQRLSLFHFPCIERSTL